MRLLAVCATCNQHSALYRTYRRRDIVRRDRQHSNCFACHRNLMNQFRSEFSTELS